jgi:hypothetical protein
MEAIVIVGLSVALALAALRWGVDSRGLNMDVVQMDLALERARELRGEGAARRRVPVPIVQRPPRVALPRSAAFRLGGWLIRMGEALRAPSVQSGRWRPIA